MPRKNKRKFFGINKNKSAKLNQNAAATTVSEEQEQSDAEDATAENCELVSCDSSAAIMGQVESTEVNSETVKDIEPPKATITLKVITQFIGDVPKETRDDEPVNIAEDSEINDNVGKSATQTSPVLLHKPGVVPKLDHNKEDTEHRHQRSFDVNYRVESPKHICIEGNQTPSKRHAMLIQEISESSSSEEVKQFLHSEATMKIDKVEHAASPKTYRVESPESSDEFSGRNTAHDVMVQEISESSSSESVKNEILASIEASTPALKFEPKNTLKVINIKELPTESNATTKFDGKTEKKLNKAEEAILEALYGNKNLLTIPNLPLDVISEEGSDCGSDIDKQAKRIADEIDDVFPPPVTKKPPLNFRRQQVAEKPQLLSAKIIETESNIPESCKSWETTQSDSELQAELVYLTSASSSATDLSERGGDVTDTDIEDTSEDTETNSLLENISVPSFEFDMPIEMKISQKSTVEYFHDTINEQKLPDILEEDEERSLDITECQQQIENVNKELHHLVSEVIQKREMVEEETDEISQEKENVEEWQMKREKVQVEPLEHQLEEMKSQVDIVSDEIDTQDNATEELECHDDQLDGANRQDFNQSPDEGKSSNEEDSLTHKNDHNTVKSQVEEMKTQAEEIESHLEEIKNQVGEIKTLLEEEKSHMEEEKSHLQEAFAYDSQISKPLEEYEDQVIEFVDFQSRVIFPVEENNQENRRQVDNNQENQRQVDQLFTNERQVEPQTSVLQTESNLNDATDVSVKLNLDENFNQIDPPSQTCESPSQKIENNQTPVKTPESNRTPVEDQEHDKHDSIENDGEKIKIVHEIISDISSDKRKITHDNDKPNGDALNRVTPTFSFKRKNSSDSSSSANSQCTIIRQSVEHVDPLKDLCMQSLKKIAFTHDADRDDKITIHKKLNSFSRNAPQIPIMSELELHLKSDNDNLGGRENRVITILQVPPEINRATSAPSHAWRGLASTQIPNLMVALSPLQQSYMSSQDSNTSADVLLDMHKKFVERRAYHESDEPEVVENSNNAKSCGVFRVNESRMESVNQLEDGYFGDRESSVENRNSKSPKANNSPETVSNFSEPVANCENEAVASAKSAEIDFRMNSIRNCLLRDEFFRTAFGEVKRDAVDAPSAVVSPPPIESFETKKFELENELKRLDNERQELEEELKNLRSLQHFKREEFLYNEKKLQSLESRHSSHNDFNDFINSNEKLQQELYNEWQDKVLERYERKLSKTIKITSINDNDHHSERAASVQLRTMPIESEFMTKLKERRQRLSLPNEMELNSSTESLHHQNEESRKDQKLRNIPAHLHEFLKYYDEEIAMSKNSDESGESKNVQPLLLGLIGVSMCLCGFYIGKYFLTQKSKLF